jgi:hypothetical protein
MTFKHVSGNEARSALLLHHVVATAVVFACISGDAVAAAITTIGPFVGSLSETWESRPNYTIPTFHFEPSPTTIMAGGASITAANMAIYEPSTVNLTNFIIGGVSAQVSDGTKGLGVSSAAALATMVFAFGLSDFGAYWGTGTPSNGVTVRFFDQGGAPIGAPIFFSYMRNGAFPGGDGQLEWHGWHSDTPIKSLTFTGDFVAIDGLQAIPIPEPASGALLLAGLCWLASRRDRFRLAPRTRAAPSGATSVR